MWKYLKMLLLELIHLHIKKNGAIYDSFNRIIPLLPVFKQSNQSPIKISIMAKTVN